MSSDYKGLYIVRGTDNKITHIQVGSGPNDFPLLIEDYEERGVKPPISDLPEMDEYLKK